MLFSPARGALLVLLLLPPPSARAALFPVRASRVARFRAALAGHPRLGYYAGDGPLLSEAAKTRLDPALLRSAENSAELFQAALALRGLELAQAAAGAAARGTASFRYRGAAREFDRFLAATGNNLPAAALGLLLQARADLRRVEAGAARAKALAEDISARLRGDWREAVPRDGLGDALAALGAPVEEAAALAEPAAGPKPAFARHGLADPFAAIEPKASREELAARLSLAPVGATRRKLLGQGSEAYAGVFAVAEKLPSGFSFYAEKIFDSAAVADRGVRALRLARRLKEGGALEGFGVAEVLSAPPGERTVRLELIEGVSALAFVRGGHPEILARYREALTKAADSLRRAGHRVNLDLENAALYVYGPEPAGGGRAPLLFQIIEQNVVVTRDGRFVLVDPF